MRHLTVFLMVLGLFTGLTLAPKAHAQDMVDLSLYQITDVVVDVTAKNAAEARDKAIMQAQHSAFEQLLDRLGANGTLAEKLDDDSLATLVQAFEVQQERTSSVRYIGTFTVQFKPPAVRQMLDKEGINYSEVRSKTMVVLPVVNAKGRDTLWEDNTPWRAAWEESARTSGVVPIIVPAGDLDAIKILSTAEAVNGKAEGLQEIMQKYEAGGVVVAILNTDVSAANPKQGFIVNVLRYDMVGNKTASAKISMPPTRDGEVTDVLLTEAVKEVRKGIEMGWKESNKVPQGPTFHLPVIVPIASLEDWAKIKDKLTDVANIKRTNVIMLTRRNANIELEFRGDIPQLQAALSQQNLSLNQDQGAGAWWLRDTITP